MDVNKTLEQLRQDANKIMSGENALSTALYMAELFQGLDEWLSKGGFLPTEWQR